MHTASVPLAEHDGRGGGWGHAVHIRHGIKHSVRRCAERCTRRRSANARSTRGLSRRGIYTKKASNICRYVRSGHIIRVVGSTAGPLARGNDAVRTTLRLDRLEDEVWGAGGSLCGACLCCGPGGWGSSHVPGSGICEPISEGGKKWS